MTSPVVGDNDPYNISMTANINQDELRLLAHLHEHVSGFGPKFPLKAEQVMDELELTADAFLKRGSFLQEHLLAGLDCIEYHNSMVDSVKPHTIWLTGLGEDYMRSLEAVPTMPRKITASVVKESWEMIRDTATQTLAQIIATLLTK